MNQHDHRAQYREAPEPEEGTRATPKIVLAWIAILIVWGVGYYAWQIGKPMLGGDSRSAVEMVQQESKPADNSADNSDAEASGSSGSGNKTAAAKPNGKAIYSAQCSACHQANGQGVPGAFPPLAESEWLLADAAIPVAIVHDGLQGAIEVAGNSFQGVMPKFGGTLSNAELAAVLSYARSEWGNSANEIDPAAVTEHVERFGERGDWSAEELKEVFGEP
ncbi:MULTISPECIES: c-type cytochrome [unclassified Marinobacter]|uniref:c-type cytochrome n=1 Tax=unclassified Marinobacter TaxID=83889 RepID=UPI0019037CB0|nr:cytochrome c [Marinobacter sp. 1-4A]MBK1851226.1 cytochrome c [Marinobacter sp. 1-4A]